MTATITYLADRQPISRPLPIPAIPPLDVMVLTLQREHLEKLTWREKARLHRAMWTLAKGDDADSQEEIEQIAKIHPIWIRVMGQGPEDAA